MKIPGRVVVVTGAASGIGLALCRRFASLDAAVVAADIDGEGAARTAHLIGHGEAHTLDVSDETAVEALVRRVVDHHGRIDVFCSNAGIAIPGSERTANEDWTRLWEVNVMAHVYAARAVLPSMLARGEGYLLQTVSAAGLLTMIGAASYAVTKHAALAFAEWLSITYGGRGIRVSALCPMGVKTRMLEDDSPAIAFLRAGAIEADAVAEEAVRGIEDERFLILPHPEVAAFFAHKAADPDRWLRRMREVQDAIESGKIPEKGHPS